MHYTLAELAQLTATQLVGAGDCQLSELASLRNATKSSVSFVSSTTALVELQTTSAGAIVVVPELIYEIKNGLLSEDPYKTYAELSVLFDIRGIPFAGEIHPSAVIAKTAILAANVSVGPNAVIGEDAIVGMGSIIGPNVTIYPETRIGVDCLIGGNSVIGSDGFGFAKSADGWIKIRQLGGVSIGNNVEIGACCSIDRGALDDTIIEDGVKLDNQVHIAHGCRVGARTAMAGCVALAGSTVIGADVTVGGMTGFTGHLSVCDKVHIGAKALVTQSISVPGTYMGGAGGVMKATDWRRNAVRFRQLDSLARRLKLLEKRLPEIG
ncbi:UDP-3-O-(3-hydroxymyristoyl)glucosamine N-acyltransferase [Litorivicinus sp.]|nr:UDP-3-O-(3-hydroxymyristoyl)glucosamine N-acyltransferase [Litorivicinus sp.]MDC1240341.1 UDP-3-O-(3-hydroxymyristoyl)glucosamine N-acyltransferase [Litorivicinus sp.]